MGLPIGPQQHLWSYLAACKRY